MNNPIIMLDDIPDPFKKIDNSALFKGAIMNLDEITKQEIESLREKTRHPLSKDLPVNFCAILNIDWPYKFSPIKDYDYGSKTNNKKDFADPNIGWKFHLNVVPDNVLAVSDYLKSKDYHHKYFNGGEIDRGKVFTVYIGSRKRTESEANLVSQDIANLLARPTDHAEAEFARGVVARFCCFGQEFKKYGFIGFDVIASLYMPIVIEGLSKKSSNRGFSEEQIKGIEILSYKRIKELYSTYFTG